MSTTFDQVDVGSSGTHASSEFDNYRAMSASAVASLALGGISLLMFLIATTGIGAAIVASLFPLFGMLFGLMSLRSMARLPGELTGKPLAVIGLTLSAICLFGGLSYAGYVYATEVPDGHERITFGKLKPSDLDIAAGRPIPDNVLELDGQRVFIKGYMRPPDVKNHITSFLLVRDNQECCFGPLNKVQYFDQMQIELAKPLTADYSTRLFRVAGRLKIRPENRFAAPGMGTNRTVYSLVADYLK